MKTFMIRFESELQLDIILYQSRMVACHLVEKKDGRVRCGKKIVNMIFRNSRTTVSRLLEAPPANSGAALSRLSS